MDTAELNSIRASILEQTPQARKIVAVLYDLADWATRESIAKALKKNRLTPHDIGLLERMCANGLVQVRKRDHPGRIGFEYIYRLRGDIHRGLNILSVYRRAKTAAPNHHVAG